MKHDRPGRRLNGVHAPRRQIAYTIARIVAMVALAMLLILGIFPAALAAQAAHS